MSSLMLLGYGNNATQCCTSVGSRQAWQDKAARHSAAQRTVAAGRESDLSHSSCNVRQITCIFFLPRTFFDVGLRANRYFGSDGGLRRSHIVPPYKSYERTKDVHFADHCVGKRVCLEEGLMSASCPSSSLTRPRTLPCRPDTLLSATSKVDGAGLLCTQRPHGILNPRTPGKPIQLAC